MNYDNMYVANERCGMCKHLENIWRFYDLNKKKQIVFSYLKCKIYGCVKIDENPVLDDENVIEFDSRECRYYMQKSFKPCECRPIIKE